MINMASLTTTTQFIECVWWYPPLEVQQYPTSINGYAIDDYGMVALQFKINAAEAGFSSDAWNLLANLGQLEAGLEALVSPATYVTVNLTPQAFTSWYASSPSAQACVSLTALNSTLTSSNAEANAANIISSQGLQWMEASAWYNSGYFQPGQFTVVDLEGAAGGGPTDIGQQPDSQVHVLYDPQAVDVSIPNLPWYIYGGILAALILLIVGLASGALGTIGRGVSGAGRAASGVARAVPTKKKREAEQRAEERDKAQLREQKAKTVTAEANASGTYGAGAVQDRYDV